MLKCGVLLTFEETKKEEVQPIKHEFLFSFFNTHTRKMYRASSRIAAILSHIHPSQPAAVRVSQSLALLSPSFTVFDRAFLLM
jgi:hypothetical protein